MVCILTTDKPMGGPVNRLRNANAWNKPLRLLEFALLKQW